MPNYISENQSPSEVFRQFGDQVPEFMQTWLEKIVNLAEDAEEVYAVINMNSKLDINSPEFEKEFTEMVEQASAYEDHKNEIKTFEDQVEDLKSEIEDLKAILNDNNIDY